MNTNDSSAPSPAASYPVDWERVAAEAGEALIAGDTLDEMMARPHQADARWLLSAARRMLTLTRQWRASLGWVAPPGWEQIEASLIRPLSLAAMPFTASEDQPGEELDEITRIGFACLQSEWAAGWKMLRPLLAHTPQPPAKVTPEPDGPLGGKRWRHAGVEVDLPHGGIVAQAMAAAVAGKPGDVVLAGATDSPAARSSVVNLFHKNIAHLRQQTGVEWPHNRIGQRRGELVIKPPHTPPN